MEFAIHDGVRRAAFKGGSGTCPTCGAAMTAKCGPRVMHHWAHAGRRNCDPWWENETPWHREWKSRFPESFREIAHVAPGVPYQLTETLFTYQVIGLGGNSMVNGMLFQTNPTQVFDRSWPAGWHWSDMSPYFDRVRARVPVTSTPSRSSRTRVWCCTTSRRSNCRT